MFESSNVILRDSNDITKRHSYMKIRVKDGMQINLNVKDQNVLVLLPQFQV